MESRGWRSRENGSSSTSREQYSPGAVAVQLRCDVGQGAAPAPVRGRPADVEAPADQLPARAFEAGDDDPGIIRIEPTQPGKSVGGVGNDFIVSLEPSRPPSNAASPRASPTGASPDRVAFSATALRRRSSTRAGLHSATAIDQGRKRQLHCSAGGPLRRPTVSTADAGSGLVKVPRW